jgi:large subunit ribosomal protein L32e
MRRQQRGWPRVVRVGYGKPASLRGVHPSGYRERIVNRPSDLTMIDSKKEIARIAGNVGERKRLAIIDKAKELQVKVLNPVGIRKPEEEKEEVVEPEVEEPSAKEVEFEAEETSKEGSVSKNQVG